MFLSINPNMIQSSYSLSPIQFYWILVSSVICLSTFSPYILRTVIFYPRQTGKKFQRKQERHLQLVGQTKGILLSNTIFHFQNSVLKPLSTICHNALSQTILLHSYQELLCQLIRALLVNLDISSDIT